MATPKKRATAKKKTEEKFVSMRGKTIVRKDGRLLRFPDEPSVIGEEKIYRAIDAVMARRKQ